MKKYIIAITLFCISLILIDDAYAMTGSYTNATYSYRDCSNPLECSTSFVSPYTQLSTNIYPTVQRIRGVSMRAYNTDGVWKTGDNYSFKWRVCEQSKWGNNESISYLRNGFNFYEFTYNTNDVATGATTGDVADVTYTISDDNSSQYCWFVNFNLTPKDDLQYVGFKASFDVTNEDGGIGLYTGNWFTVGRLDIDFTEGVGSIIEENSQEIIKEQQQTNDKLDNLNDSLTNDNTSGANDSASSFFDSFTSEDNGGISSIITAPLNLINGMLDVNTNTCNPLSVNILGKDVDLPCGKLLWSRAPDSIVVLWQTIICGFFSYKLIVSLYHDIDKLKDPEQKGVDTLDL